MGNIISVGVNDFGLEEMAKTYPLQVREIATKSARKSAQECRNMLKGTSPKKYGGYASGWSVKNKSSLASGVEFVIHNKNKPTLVHLLDDGHELVLFGKPTGKRVVGDPHFKNAKKKAGDLFEKYVDEGLRKLI